MVFQPEEHLQELLQRSSPPLSEVVKSHFMIYTAKGGAHRDPLTGGFKVPSGRLCRIWMADALAPATAHRGGPPRRRAADQAPALAAARNTGPRMSARSLGSADQGDALARHNRWPPDGRGRQPAARLQHRESSATVDITISPAGDKRLEGLNHATRVLRHRPWPEP